MKVTKTASVILLVAVFLLLLSCVFVVREGQHGLLLRLGQLTTDSAGKVKVYMPGIHFKIPFINQAKVFDTRLQTLGIQSSRIVTAEKKDVLVDYFVKWRIQDLSLYYTRTGGNENQTEILLQQQLNDGLRAQFGRRIISEVVSGERSDIMEILQEQANQNAQRLGVEVVDVRIKRIDLPTEVSAAVFERMRTERQRIANQHRANGKSAAEAIRASADAAVTVILAKARSDAQAVRGEGDRQAAGIYAQAYTRDPDFFAFYRSISAYQESFAGQQDLLVLNSDSEFFQFFNQAQGTQNHGATQLAKASNDE